MFQSCQFRIWKIKAGYSVRLLICAGGTGGGVYPALTVLQALISIVDPVGFDLQQSVLWVGSHGGMEADLVKRANVPFETIPAAGVHGVGLSHLPGNVGQLWRGYRTSRRILRRFKPEVLFFTGGYVAVPMALAGRKLPSVLYVPDIEPGLALKTLAHLASSIAITADDSRTYFSPHADLRMTGYPTRLELETANQKIARVSFGLDPQLPTLLVFGGSKGARSINQALMAVLPTLLAEMQVIHISGKLDWPEVQAAGAKLDGQQARRYRAYPYLHQEMVAALRAADLVLSRAGASSLGEYPMAGLPAILVPYPYAWRYQVVNAQYLVRHGAAVMIKDEALPDQLLPTVLELMHDSARRERMQQAMLALSRPQAAGAIANLLVEMAQRSGGKGIDR
jgi:undecaprenyldiphospho-muramoylpentapeptide beta-N-acetylglucosaminyltransferase